jgi:hypothetical protein
MPPTATVKKPFNPLKTVRARVNANDVMIQPDSLQDAQNDFNWSGVEIKQALLKLNDKYYYDNKLKNHYYNTKPHESYPAENTYIDYYRAHNLLDGESVYTHFYIREHKTTVIINSFKELYNVPED